jgi:phosphoglycerol transferase MdoB-like AlkP superfamily enzyme
MGLWTVALLVFVINLPFGYWRASVRRLSTRWFLAALIPVPVVIALNIYSGFRFRLIIFPVIIGAFFLGQFVGGRLRNIIQGRGPGRSHG